MRAVSQDEPVNSEWFRAPTRREHWIAAALCVGFGLFFVMLFLLQAGWWFRWVVLGLGVISMLHGARHALDGVRSNR